MQGKCVFLQCVGASMCVGEPHTHTGQYTQLGIFFFIHIHTYITALLCFSDESLWLADFPVSRKQQPIDLFLNTGVGAKLDSSV